MSEIEIQTSETIETLKKNEKDRKQLLAKLEENKAIARERDEWKKKYDEMQITLKEEKTKTLKRVIYGKREPSISGNFGNNEIIGWIQGHASQDEGTGTVQHEGARGSSADTTIYPEL